MRAVRAIIIKDNKLLVMHRNKFGKEYYTLIGGGIDVGEDPESAVRREVMEETGIQLGRLHHVFTEQAPDPYGIQAIFLCEYLSGEPQLSPDSEEAKITALGHNLYEPLWLPLEELIATNFLSHSVRDAILNSLKNGWPENPETLVWQ